MHIDPEQVQMEASWKQALYEEFRQPYFLEIKKALLAAREQHKTIYPPNPLIFNAFQQTPLDQVRAVIIGQDPYHQPGQALGLCFAVARGVKVPPSLRNIYKEIARTEAGFVMPDHGDLTNWARQGVLLLNAALTVEAGKANSHGKIGWHQFTDAVIRTISAQKEGVIFLLWGNFAKEKAALIDGSRHHILTAVHPSPLAGGGFVGCGHFQRVNEILRARGEAPIDWQV